MAKPIARIFESLLRLLLPARGRHRAAGPLPAARRCGALAPVLPHLPAVWPKLLQGEDIYLIRPYVLTPEERQERRLQRGRRRTLWLAVHGVDVGPRWIHGVEVMG
ncbi:hypothetical protein [Streptomyces chattanoogensis]|uniref:hypothetical protein n=1 Tax=Streptomyces chattanoogensis TaxID=66876 RepID=UPI0036C30B6A